MRAPLVCVLLVAAATDAHAAPFDNMSYANMSYANMSYANMSYANMSYANMSYANTAHANGGTVDGFTLGPMVHANGQVIESVALVQDYLTGYTWVWESVRGARPDWHYRALAPLEFEGATLQAPVYEPATVDVVDVITLRITDITTTTGADGGTYYQHLVEWRDDSDGSFAPLCGCEADVASCMPVSATLVQGAWNYTQGTADGGSQISNDPGLVTIACAQAAIGKCAADKSVLTPLTPTYRSSIAAGYASWNHKGSFPVSPGGEVVVELSNGSGNLDLYTHWNSTPTATAYDCSPSLTGSDETCTLVAPAGAHTVHVSVFGAGAGSATLSVWTDKPRGMGYKPWGSYGCQFNDDGIICDSATSRLGACTRMVTADYCGDGVSHTIPGRPIDVFDFYDDQVNQPVLGLAPPDWFMEAEWTADGANWINSCRYDVLDLGGASWTECPSYDGVVHPIELQPVADTTTWACSTASNPEINLDQGFLYNMHDGTYIPASSSGWILVAN